MPSSAATPSSCTLAQWFSSDEQVHHLYPESIQQLARRHWTPIKISQLVVEFLTPKKDVKVLDIGSGVGKFCLAGAYFNPFASFYGIEQRKDLVSHAETAKSILGLQNVHFLHGNFTYLDFKEYDHFYFYNSFYENLSSSDKIDNSIIYSNALYHFYNRFLFKKLNEMPVGTRVATFHKLEDKLPPGYCLVETKAGNALKCWMKI